MECIWNIGGNLPETLERAHGVVQRGTQEHAQKMRKEMYKGTLKTHRVSEVETHWRAFTVNPPEK